MLLITATVLLSTFIVSSVVFGIEVMVIKSKEGLTRFDVFMSVMVIVAFSAFTSAASIVIERPCTESIYFVDESRVESFHCPNSNQTLTITEDYIACSCKEKE